MSVFRQQRPSHSDARFTVSTRSRHRVTSKSSCNSPPSSAFHVPLTVSDVHLRHEQLPFAYYFAETLDPKQLRSSLRRVLHRFPVVSGTVPGDNVFQSIVCCPTTDSISLTFGDMQSSMEEWIEASRGHVHIAGMGHPTLLPIFDSLFHDQGSREADCDDSNTAAAHDDNDGPTAALLPYDNLLKIRVTHFSCGGTVLGVNFLHMLGDTASCVRFVRCWGREMRQRTDYSSSSSSSSRNDNNARALVNVSGMMTVDRAEQMGIGVVPPTSSSWMAQCYDDWFVSSSTKESPVLVLDDTAREQHEYVALCFPLEVLESMKRVGMAACEAKNDASSFVSTNDMVTAFGWLLKRSLSGEHSWNIGMVLNMRRHCGSAVNDDNEDVVTKPESLFGNGITNIVATHPVTTESITILDISQAARSIRLAIEDGLVRLPHRLFQSRTGKTPVHVSAADSFSTTSWSQFPLASISFSPHKTLTSFHGHPSCPLPLGQSTYASVIVEDLVALQGEDGGGSVYHLLLPSDQVQQATAQHADLCAAFIAAAAAARDDD